MLKYLEVTNIKNIENFEQEFNGSVYLVTGDNEKGKSSLISSIFTSITGDRSNNLLKKGEEKGQIYAEHEIDGEIYNITLSVTEKNPRGALKIERQNDIFKSNNKSALDAIFGYQNFDASEFVAWSESAKGRKKQIELILGLLPDEVQKRIVEIDSTISCNMEERKGTWNKVDKQKAIISNYSIDRAMCEKYEKEINIDDLKTKKEKAEKTNQNIADINRIHVERVEKLDEWPEYENEQLKPHQEAIDMAQRSIKDLELKLKNAKEYLKMKNGEYDTKKADLDDKYKRTSDDIKKQAIWLRENKPVDITELTTEYETAVAHNQMHARVVEYNGKKDELVNLENQYKAETDAIEQLRKERKQLVAENPLPVDGLSFDNDQLLLNGIPFAEGEVSTSQIMDVAVKLMMAKNPNCKMFHISRGESLGGEKLKSIIDYANENGYQGFIEVVKPFQDNLVVEEYTEV